MSIEIMYGKQFIDLGNGRYVGMVLMGSSNCTIMHNGREILERYWTPFWDFVNVSEQEMIDRISPTIHNDTDYERFKENGKFITDSTIIKWLKNCVKSARSIEEIKKVYPYQSLHCYIYLSNQKEYGNNKRVENEFCNTTEEILNWYEKAQNYVADENYRKYYCMEFSGIEPLRMGKKIDPDTKCICKIKNGYLSKIHDNGYSYSMDKSDAIIFENKEDFENRFLNSSHSIPKYTLVKYNGDECQKNTAVYVIANNNAFVKRISSRHIFYSYNKANARKFPSLKSADQYIENNRLRNYIPECFVTKYEEA